MACGSLVEKDFMNAEMINNSDPENCHKDELLTPSDSVKEDKDTTQTLDLFEINSIAESFTPHNTNHDEGHNSEAIKSKMPLLPPAFSSVGVRKSSLLERALFPGLSRDVMLSGDKAASPQLTIFYAGTINVYDDVPFDKAQAIMLLAGQKSVSTTVHENITKTDVKKSLNPLNLPPVCGQLNADVLPLSRKISLQRFLERRRGRITSKQAPYATSNTKHDEPTAATNDLNQRRRLTLSPFPSRSPNFYPACIYP